MFLLITLAIILSVDAFSVAISIGLYENNQNKYLLFSIIVGILHFIMPVLGTITNKLFISKLLINGNHFLGIILIIIAIQIFIDLRNDKAKEMANNNLGLLAIAVSVDSYFTGLGLKSINIKISNYLIFSIVSFLFSFIGCRIGNKTKRIFNKYANYVAVLILLILGVKFLFI